MSETAARLRLLIVESDESVKRVLQRAVAARFEVTPLASGASAMGRLREERFDVVLVDLALSDIAGLELVRQVRALQPTLPVIVTDPSLDGGDSAELKALGVIAVLKKPFGAADLGEALARASELARPPSRR